MKKILFVLCIVSILVSCLFTLVSCGDAPNEDPALAREALESEGYTVVDGKASASRFGIVGITSSMHAYKEYESVTIFYFADDESAEAAYDAIEKTIKNEKTEYAREGREYPDLGLETGVDGTVVWIGTPEAIAAAS